MLRRRYGTAPRCSAPPFCPLTITAPEVGRSIAGMSLRSVDLPAPERPVRNAISPASSAKLTFSRALLPPAKRLATAEKLTNQRLREIARDERSQVVDVFADADEEQRHRSLGGDRAGRAALRRAIEFRQHQAGETER